MHSKGFKHALILAIVFLSALACAIVFTGVYQQSQSFALDNSFKLTIYFKDLSGTTREVYIIQETNNDLHASTTLNNAVSVLTNGTAAYTTVGGNLDQFREAFSKWTVIGAESYDSKNNEGNTENKHYGMYDTIYFNSWDWAITVDSKIYLEWRDSFGCEFKLNSSKDIEVLESSGTIDSKADLQELRDLVNRGFSYDGCYLDLTTDINLNNENWIPIGVNTNKRFKGSFDGCGHIISNLLIRRDSESDYETEDYAMGLFGFVEDSSISDLCLDGVTIQCYKHENYSGSGWGSTDHVGCLVGATFGNWTTIYGCMVLDASIDVVDDGNGSANAGGLVGSVCGKACTVNMSGVQCDIVVRKDTLGFFNNIGGIVGMPYNDHSNVSVYNSYFYGTIESRNDAGAASNYSTAAGIVGTFRGDVINKLSDILIRNCLSIVNSSSYVEASVGTAATLWMHSRSFEPIWSGDTRGGTGNGTIYYDGGNYSFGNNYYVAGADFSDIHCSADETELSEVKFGGSYSGVPMAGSISSEPGTIDQVDTFWYSPRSDTIANGLPIQRQFIRWDDWVTVTFDTTEGGQVYYDGEEEKYDSISLIVPPGESLTVSGLGSAIIIYGYTIRSISVADQYVFSNWSNTTPPAINSNRNITAIYTLVQNNVNIVLDLSEYNSVLDIELKKEKGALNWIQLDDTYTYNLYYGATIQYSSTNEILTITNTYIINANPDEYADLKIEIISGGEQYEFAGWEYSSGSSNYQPLTNSISLGTTDINLRPIFTLREYEAEFSVTSNGTNALGGILLDGEVEYELDETYTFVYGATLIRDNMSITITQPEGFEDRASLTLTASPGNGYSFTAWEYMYAGDSIWTTLGANTSIELTGDIYIRAYFAPIEYELPLSYIANSQGIYNETMVDFTIESPNQTFITDEDFMDSLTGEEDRYIDEQNKSFGAWVVGVDGNRILQSGSPVDDYTVNVSTSYITIEAVDESGYWTLIRSVDNGNTFVSIEGYTYYVVLGLEQGSYGDLGEEIIILKWSNTYTIRVSNNDLNYWNESGIDRDEYIGVGSIGLETDGDEILLEVKFNSRYAYPFMSSVMNNRALSFYKGSQYTTSNIMATSDMGSYYVYNYGYEITGWILQFTYSGQSYYLYIRNNDWTVLRAVGGRYQYLNSTGSWIDAGLSSPVVPIGVLTNETMNDMSLYAETLDEMFAFDGTLSETEILMFPTWEATEIEVRTSNSNGETVLTTATYKQGYTFSNNVLSSLARTGESLIYFVENSSIGTDEDVIVTGTGETIWNYKDLDHSQYDYEDGLYIIDVTARYVDNVYKVELIGARQQDGAYNLTDSDYTMSSNRTYTEDSYTYKSFYGYRDYPGGWIEEYGSELATLGATYNSALAGGTLEPLRKVYTDGSEMYIYLANDQRTGDLPIFRIDYYTLIYWINVNSMADGTRYVYTTREYDVDLHGSIEEGITHTGNEAGLWRYEDGGANKDIDGLEAKYFRKSYDVAVQTIAEGRQGEYGYVVVEIEDTVVPNTASADNEGGRYLFIYNNGMKIYEYSGDSLPRDVSTLDEVTGGYIRLYAGCDIEVIAYDQSRDVEAMKSGNYDMMIGYRLVEIVGGIFSGTDTDGDNYRRGMTAEEIESENWATGSRYVIEVEYEKISYDLVIEMSAGDTSQGNFTLNYPNGSQSGYMWRVELEGITVGETYQIRYNALAGYEYQEIAYSLILPNGYVVTLQTRAVWEADNTNQSYILVFDGTWLRENYYTVEVNGEEEGADPEYSVVDAGLGTLRVNTEEVEFRYNIMVYDSMHTGDDAWIDEIEVGTFKLSDVTLEVSSAFEALTSVGYGYIGESGEYAIISSYAYIVRNPMNRDRHYMSYSFPCRSIPTDEFEITTGLLGEMLNVSQYSIVGNTVEERTIYMTIEVRRIYEVIVEVEQGEHDTNSSERITRISNGTDNIVDVVLSASSTVDSEGVYTTRGRIYSYEGQTNRLSSIYDENRYSGVRYYYIEGEAREELDGNEFELVNDTLIRVEYIANSLAVEIVYELEGEVVGESELEGILTELEVTPREGLYEGSEIEIRESHERGYIVEIVVNGRVQTLENGETIYTVQDQDYDGGVIEIVVEITSEPRDEVSVELRIYNNEEILGNEDIGEVRIEVDGEVQEGSEATILEGQRVAFVIYLEAGYRYYGYRQNSGNVIQGGTGERIEVTDSFSIEEDAGRYIIYVEKERIDVVLRLGAEQKKNYMIESDNLRARKESNADNSEIRIVGVYVGNRITINRLEELEDEALRNYYYVIGDEAIEIVGNELELTSELIGRAGDELEIRVNSVNKYKLELEILNGEDELEIESNVELEENGRALYYEEGTIVELEIRTKTGDRYTIRASGDLEGEGDEIIGEIELDSDKEIEISIEPKRYEAEEDERVYTSVDGLDRGESEEAEGISGIEKEGQIYGETSIVRVNLRGEYLGESARLKRLEIEEESGRRIEIELEGDEIKVTVDGEEKTLTGDTLEIEGEIYRVRQTGERLELEYVTRGEMRLEIEYIVEKEISA